MPYQVVSFQSTPNPNALKCVLDRSPAPSQPRSYTNLSAAAQDPLGTALMSIPDISNVLIHDGWISVGKSPQADWKAIKAALKKVLSESP